MDSEYIDNDFTCRACLENSNETISIFQYAPIPIMNKSVMLCTVLNYCTNLEIFEGDGLPTQLCNKCVDEVTKAFIFKQQFIRADTILRTKLTNVNVEVIQHDSVSTFEHVIIKQELSSQSKLNLSELIEIHEIPHTAEIDISGMPDAENVVEPTPSSENESNSDDSEDQYDPEIDEANSVSGGSDNEAIKDTRDKLKKIVKEENSNGDGNGELTERAIRTYITRRKKDKQSYEQVFTCEVCAKTLSSAGSLKTHLLIHKAETPFPCNKCGQKFKSKLAYEAHAVTHDPHNPYKCTECGRGFRNDSALEEHKLRAHKGEKPYLCGVCGKGFTQMVALKKHMMIHTGEKPYECETCGKQFRYKNVLILHRRYHTDERPYPCSECDLKFREKTHLRRHLLIHTGVKPYNCEFCGKCFNRRTNLKAHRKIHTGEREHICPICGKGFIQQNCLKAHIAGHEKKERKMQQKQQTKEKIKKDQQESHREELMPPGQSQHMATTMPMHIMLPGATLTVIPDHHLMSAAPSHSVSVDATFM